MFEFFDNYFEIFITFVFVIALVLLLFPFIKGDRIKVEKIILIGDRIEFIYNNKIFRVSSSSVGLTSLKFSYFYYPRSVFGVHWSPSLYLCIEDYEKLFGEINESEK